MHRHGRLLHNRPVGPLRVGSSRARKFTALIIASATRWSSHNAPRLGAALAFYTLLSIAPLLIVVTAIAGFAYGSDAARNEIVAQAGDVAGAAGAAVAAAILGPSATAQHGALATVLGVVLGLISASGAVGELRSALNIICDVPVPDTDTFKSVMNILREKLFAAALVLFAGFFLLLSLAANVFVSALAAWGVGASLVSFLVVTFLFAAVFKFLPDQPIGWREALLGALVTSVLFEIGRQLIALYLSRANFAAAYGAAASTTALLVWVYYSSQIFFFGAAFTKELESRKT
jgi:membrane protein